MRVKLVRCVCDNWYSPIAHQYRCPACGCAKVNRRHFKFTTSGVQVMPRGFYHYSPSTGYLPVADGLALSRSIARHVSIVRGE